MQQFETSLDMMRNGCTPKFKVPIEILDNLRAGEFIENNGELKVKCDLIYAIKNILLEFANNFFIMQLKCYTRCIAQLAGTVSNFYLL